MRIARSQRGVLAGASILAVALVAASAALATHRPGPKGGSVLFNGQTLNETNFNDGLVKLRTKGPVRLLQLHVVRPNDPVLPPLQPSGWHTHPGLEMIAVAEGEVTVTEADCQPVTIGPGQAYFVAPDSPANVSYTAIVDFTATFLFPLGTSGIPGTPVDSPC
jgi:quercetin dioxygenase-like cupin family protein